MFYKLLFRRRKLDVHVPSAASLVEHDGPVCCGKKRVVTPAPHIDAGMEFCAVLTYKDFSSLDNLAAKAFYPEPLAM